MATTSIGAPGVTFPDATVQASASPGEVITRIYTSPSPWSKPASLKAIRVTVCSGGGGGSAGSTTVGGKRGGGGAAGYLYLQAPAIPAPLTVTVGAGGTPGAVSGGSGGSGGTSSFGPLISNTGGGGGTVPTPGAAGVFTPSPARWGANGLSGTQGADSGLGFGNADVSAPGAAGVGFGAGGGGGTGGGAPTAGGAGTAGIVIVEEFY